MSHRPSSRDLSIEPLIELDYDEDYGEDYSFDQSKTTSPTGDVTKRTLQRNQSQSSETGTGSDDVITLRKKNNDVTSGKTNTAGIGSKGAGE